MLVYRQRKLMTERTGPIEIPDYWRAEVDKINKQEEMLRQNYFKLRNKFIIYLEDSSNCFTISDDNVVKRSSTAAEENKLVLEFTDTIEMIKSKVKVHLKLSQSANVNLIEVIH